MPTDSMELSLFSNCLHDRWRKITGERKTRPIRTFWASLASVQVRKKCVSIDARRYLLFSKRRYRRYRRYQMVTSFGRLVSQRLSSVVGSISWLCKPNGEWVSPEKLPLKMDCLRIKVAKRKFYIKSTKVSAERQKSEESLRFLGLVTCLGIVLIYFFTIVHFSTLCQKRASGISQKNRNVLELLSNHSSNCVVCCTK